MGMADVWGKLSPGQKGAVIGSGVAAVVLGVLIWTRKPNSAAAATSPVYVPSSGGSSSVSEGGQASTNSSAGTSTQTSNRRIYLPTPVNPRLPYPTTGATGPNIQLPTPVRPGADDQWEQRARALQAAQVKSVQLLESLSNQLDQVLAGALSIGKGGVSAQSGALPVVPIIVPPSTQPPDPPALSTRQLQVYVDAGQAAGYVTRTITYNPKDDYQAGILAAKDKYLAGEKTGDKAAQDQARAEATRWRELAKENQVELPDWAR